MNKKEQNNSPANKNIKGLELASRIARILSDNKAEDLILMDLRGLSTITDYLVVVSGNSAPHLKALLNETEATLKKEGVYCFSKAASPDSGWVVLDYVDVVIHILSREAREYYSIENLWDHAPRIDFEDATR